MRPTRWTVITGAPCSGKTTVIRRLEQMGYRVVHEVARSIIDLEMARGLTLEQIRSDPDRFERGILERKLAIESDLPEDEEIFFDRGMPDSIAYFRIEGLDPAAPTAASRIRRYRQVWFFHRLACETQIRDLGGTVRIRPLAHLPIYVCGRSKSSANCWIH